MSKKNMCISPIVEFLNLPETQMRVRISEEKFKNTILSIDDGAKTCGMTKCPKTNKWAKYNVIIKENEIIIQIKNLDNKSGLKVVTYYKV